jgi:hypothetical protein
MILMRQMLIGEAATVACPQEFEAVLGLTD